ncbi:MAG: hypothetical protein IJZ00_11720, partial [Lachnospiraceae bacterium]|nr:hypothetical protein [Lachnospiraceae bacterium]
HFRPSAFQTVLTSLPAPPISGLLLFRRCAHFFLHRPFPAFCFSGGALISPCTAHFRPSAFQAVLLSLLHRPFPAFCFLGGALISPCTALFSPSAFQAVRTLLLAPLISDFLFSGGANTSPCTAHF